MPRLRRVATRRMRELAVLAPLAARMLRSMSPQQHAPVPQFQAAGKTARAAGSATVREARMPRCCGKRSAEHAKGSDADANAGLISCATSCRPCVACLQ